MRLRSNQRLVRGVDFLYVRKAGVYVNTGCFALYVRRREEGEGGVVRLGLIVSRRVGNSVKRNYIKRVFREVFRRNQGVMEGVWDILMIAYPNITKFEFKEIERRYLMGLERGGVYGKI